MKHKIVYLILLTIIILSCEKNDSSTKDTQQVVLFQVEYINYAWGYSHNGIIIDSTGHVGFFRLPENWHTPDALGFISESDMNDNLKQLNNVSVTVEKSALYNYSDKLQVASLGELSDPYNRMFDAGTTDYSGFLYYPSLKSYKKVLLKQCGDWAIDNNSQEAEEIYGWLKIIYDQVLAIRNNQ